MILVEHLDASGQRSHRPLWLIAIGVDWPPLEALWQLYLRRFCVDHWYRFIKQRLHWCLPQLATAEQSDRWSQTPRKITRLAKGAAASNQTPLSDGPKALLQTPKDRKRHGLTRQ